MNKSVKSWSEMSIREILTVETTAAAVCVLILVIVVFCVRVDVTFNHISSWSIINIREPLTVETTPGAVCVLTLVIVETTTGAVCVLTLVTVDITAGAICVLILVIVDAEGVRVTLKDVSNVTMYSEDRSTYRSSRGSGRYDTRFRSDGGLRVCQQISDISPIRIRTNTVVVEMLVAVLS